MMLGATRGGTADALLQEMSESQPMLLNWMRSFVSRMPPKAYRWVAEMEEVSDFAGANPAAKDMYAAVAQFYAHMARDFASDQKDVAALKEFVGKNAKN